MVGGNSAWVNRQLLGSHCLPHLKPEIKKVLLRRAWGEPVAAISLRESISFATAKHRLEQGLNAVFDGLSEPVPRDGYTAGCWVGAHLECCLVDQVNELRLEAGAA